MDKFEELVTYCTKIGLRVEVTRGTIYWSIRLRNLLGEAEMKKGHTVEPIGGSGITLDEAAKYVLKQINLRLEDGMRVWIKGAKYYDWNLR